MFLVLLEVVAGDGGYVAHVGNHAVGVRVVIVIVCVGGGRGGGVVGVVEGGGGVGGGEGVAGRGFGFSWGEGGVASGVSCFAWGDEPGHIIFKIFSRLNIEYRKGRVGGRGVCVRREGEEEEEGRERGWGGDLGL